MAYSGTTFIQNLNKIRHLVQSYGATDRRTWWYRKPIFACKEIGLNRYLTVMRFTCVWKYRLWAGLLAILQSLLTNARTVSWNKPRRFHPQSYHFTVYNVLICHTTLRISEVGGTVIVFNIWSRNIARFTKNMQLLRYFFVECKWRPHTIYIFPSIWWR